LSIPYLPDAHGLGQLGFSDYAVEQAAIRRAVGCPRCQSTGYRGRIALYETMTIDDEIRRLIVAGASASDIERRAVANGMDTLRTAAMRQVLAGSLTIDEMMRVVAK
jgi:type IV pilus assembly protein PilB